MLNNIDIVRQITKQYIIICQLK